MIWSWTQDDDRSEWTDPLTGIRYVKSGDVSWEEPPLPFDQPGATSAGEDPDSERHACESS